MFCSSAGSSSDLCTTTPEDMAAGMRWYLHRCAWSEHRSSGVFTVLLSLRFTSIVFEGSGTLAWIGCSRGTMAFAGLERHSQCIQFLLSAPSSLLGAPQQQWPMYHRGYMGAGQHRLFSPERGARGPALGRTLMSRLRLHLLHFPCTAEQVWSHAVYPCMYWYHYYRRAY